MINWIIRKMEDFFFRKSSNLIVKRMKLLNEYKLYQAETVRRELKDIYNVTVIEDGIREDKIRYTIWNYDSKQYNIYTTLEKTGGTFCGQRI